MYVIFCGPNGQDKSYLVETILNEHSLKGMAASWIMWTLTECAQRHQGERSEAALRGQTGHVTPAPGRGHQQLETENTRRSS